MSDLSIVEFLVYGFLCYSSILMLIISTIIKLPESNRYDTLIRSVFLMPGMFCAAILAMSGVNINIQETHDIITDLNSSRVWSDHATNAIVLQNSIWVLVHMMLFFVLFIYVIRQVLLFLMAPG